MNRPFMLLALHQATELRVLRREGAVVSLFPALVTSPDGTVFETCRVITHPEGTDVWWWDRDLGDARVVLTTDGAPARNSPGSRQYTLATVDGDVQVIHQTGCACGHPMKRWVEPKPPRVGT